LSSAMGYIPLDSDTLHVFSEATKNSYVMLAFMMLVLYDHVITLDKEIEWIWTLRWGLPKIIFLINRYLITPLILLAAISQTLYPLSQSFCGFAIGFVTWSPLLTFSGAELLMIFRVCSLYGHHKLVVWFLRIYFILVVTTSTALQVLAIMMNTFSYILYENVPGCYSVSDGHAILWAAWVPALTLEGVLVLLMAYKVISYPNNFNQTITLLARDSTIYFAIMFVGLLLTVEGGTHWSLPVPPLFPTQCITSIAVGRMMMNLRGLILDDPEHTVHLQTLEFARRHDSSSDKWEAA